MAATMTDEERRAAGEAARKIGSNPAATDALATATAGPVTVGGFILQPASRGTVWTLRRAAREFVAWANALGMPRAADADTELGTRELIELGLSTLIFCDSRACWISMEIGHLENLITRAEALMWDLPVETLAELEKHFREQMRRISELSSPEEDTRGK